MAVSQGQRRLRQFGARLVEQGSSTAHLIGDGLGATFLQKHTIGRCSPTTWRSWSSTGGSSSTNALCWDGRKPQSPAVQEFREFVLARAARLLKPA